MTSPSSIPAASRTAEKTSAAPERLIPELISENSLIDAATEAPPGKSNARKRGIQADNSETAVRTALTATVIPNFAARVSRLPFFVVRRTDTAERAPYSCEKTPASAMTIAA